MNVYILIGLPGSGKSTWSKNKANHNTIIISRDDFRTILNSKYYYNIVQENMIVDMVNECINIALHNQYNVIIDETNVKKARRLELLSIIENYKQEMLVVENVNVDINVVYVWFTEIENNLRNRMKSDKGVDKDTWNDVINYMQKNFDEPDLDEHFHELIKVKFGENNGCI
jgi:predicted kinase